MAFCCVAATQAKWHNKRNALVMSRPSVVPRHAVTVGSLKGGTVIGKTPEERGKLYLGFYTQNFYRAVNNMRLTARSFDFAQDDKED